MLQNKQVRHSDKDLLMAMVESESIGNSTKPGTEAAKRVLV